MDWIISLFQWLDQSPARYAWTAWITFAGVFAGALVASPNFSVPVTVRSRLLFAIGLLLTFAAFRWPSWFVPTDLNPDEAQIIAGAITLQHSPIYWKYVDGTTHGPLCEFPLVVAGWLGAPVNYVTARIVAAVLQSISLIAVWRTLRCFTNERVARLAILPGLAFWAFSFSHEYVHYSSELAGLTLLSLSTWALARAVTAPAEGGGAARWTLLAGVVMGAVPFAKLQSAPQSAVLAATALIALWWTPAPSTSVRWQRVRILVVGGAFVPVLCFIFLLTYGLIAQFKFSYLLSGVDYTHAGIRLGEMPTRFLNMSLTGYSFAWFFAGTLAFILLYARQVFQMTIPLRGATIAGWLSFGIALACVVLPGRESPHYLHLLVVPVTLLSGLTLAGAMEPSQNPTGMWPVSPALAAFVVLTLAPQIYQRINTAPEYIGELANNRTHRSDVATFILERVKPDDTLAMWGWEPGLYVETGLPQATREAHSALEIAATPLQAFYISRYLGDMGRRQPAWFVDAVGPGGFMYTDRSLYAHEMHPALRDLVAREFEFMGEFGNKRVYHRKK